MPIRFACTCGKEFIAKDEHAGMHARCTACGADLTIPGPQPAAQAYQPAPAPAGPGGPSGQIFCPRCRAINSDQAIFCYACGTNLPRILPAAGFQLPGASLYAGFWRRFVAWILDTLLTGVCAGIIGFALGFIYALVVIVPSGPKPPQEQMLVLQIIVQAIVIVLCWLYFALMERSSLQATLGKMAIGIRVTDLDGKRISFARATGRHFGKIISGLMLLIGYIMAGFTEKKQALHDMMAGTLVVRKW